MKFKIGDKVKIQVDIGRYAIGWDTGDFSEYLYWEENGMIKHGSSIVTEKYYKEWAEIIDIKGKWALVKVPCEEGVTIPFQINTLELVKYKISRLITELD